MYDQQYNKRCTCRYWVHPVSHKRETEGAWETFIKGCRTNFPEKYEEALRMYSDSFDKLLGYLKESIVRKDTKFKKAVCVEQR